MPGNSQILIQPPLGGIVKSTGFQNRQPYTAYDLLNMWPINPFTGQAILASRAPRQELTAPADFNTLLQNVNGVVSGKPTQSFIGAFNGALYWWNGTGFTAATGAQASGHSATAPIYAATLFDHVYIPQAGSKLIDFDYETGAAATIVESLGTSPDDTFFAVEWAGAIWVVDNDEPHVLHGSRVGNALDWDNTAPVDDEFGAYSTTVTRAGAIGAPINAMAPQTNDVALVSTLNGIFALRGHPRQGGNFERVTSTYMLGQGAWAKGPDDTIYFLTPFGMMAMQAGAYTVPAQVSKEKVPEDLIGLDYDYENPKVSMAYSSRWNAILIAVRGADEQAWAYFLDTGGFHRMEVIGYPYVMMEHQPFVTDQSCGVLWGGVDVHYFDKFGTEEFESAATIGPIKVTDSSFYKGKIIRLKYLFGGDTPTGEGRLGIAMGTDGQDAINRSLLGEYQFEVDLQTLAANDGVCLPHVAGHAMVVDFSSDSGRVAMEGIEVGEVPAGINRLPRTEQIAPDGEPIDFTDPSDDFDDENWVGYSGATPNTPNCTLPDHSLFVDLSRLPQGWWDVVSPTGGDIRVTNDDNEEVPRDIVDFDINAQTGFLVLKMTQQNPPTPVRIWAGNPFVGDYEPADANGQYNAYDDNWRAFWPFGGARDDGEEDRTQYLNHITLVNEVDSANLVAGPIGVQATDYVAVDATNNYGRATASIPTTAYPTTFVVVAKDEDLTSLPCLGLRDQSGPTTANVELTVNRTAAVHRTDAGSTDTGASAAEAQSGTVANNANFQHFAGVITSATSRAAYLQGGNEGTNATNITIANGVLDEIVIGKGARSGLSAASTTADLCLAQVHDAARSECWINYQYQMLDQDDFWGDWSDFVEINDPDEIDPPDPPPDDTVTCPTGFVTPTETGTWSGYAEATPDAPTANLPNFVHWIDLSDMPASWWAAVASDGHDIRATNEANIFLPIDLIEFDSVGMTGFAAVRLNQLAGSPAKVRLWVGNATAITLTVCADYGRYRVYDSNWLGFWPDGGGTDRTSYQNDMTAVGATVGAVTGPIGNFATSYNGSTQYSTLLISPSLGSYPATLAAVARTTDFTQTGAVVSAVRTQYLSHDTLVHVPGTAPVRFRARANNKTHDAVSLTTVSSNTWTHECGIAANNITRNVIVAGGTLYASPKKSLSLRTFGRLSVGARRTGSGEIYWPFAGDICLVSAHNTVRATDNSWAVYQAAMLDQNNFWNLGGSTWTWTAEVSSLPQ